MEAFKDIKVTIKEEKDKGKECNYREFNLFPISDFFKFRNHFVYFF